MAFSALAAVFFTGFCVLFATILAFSPRQTHDRKKVLARLRAKFPYSVSKIAHRGGSILGPENTLYAFHRAVKEGAADMLELDVRETMDYRIVVCHDEWLERLCGSAYKHVTVKDITVGDDPNTNLPQLQRNIPLHFVSSEKTMYCATDSVPVDGTTRLCLLEEVFEAFPTIPIHIDIKYASSDFTDRIFDLIKKYGREPVTFVGSSNWRNEIYITRYMKRLSSQKDKCKFHTFAGPIDYVLVHVAHYIGVLPLIPLNFDIFSVPLFTKRKKQEIPFFLRPIAQLLNSPSLWMHLQQRGILVVGWVLNDVDEFEEASRWPINGVMTDDPISFNGFLISHDVSNTMNLLN
ncbi:glycerophosphoryl diester phosphodiesterase [Trypanosoma brucei gambiense DAL972]|uniref:Glycerophosphoryl diester phosphodiesterase n=2 Tax=Trypanosoma brucei TaxID=5691 RepID=D0A869_TRYB9|nr:glycerophosphoryl diester phosphodiesterase [Trypanosoma brucei gambiense DAL972]RHW67555.1 glycerophosphoryl diester phosphodiesterase [Trypanosoma brucei equiperdum]CBH17870.1 glycerophosphoryl diester phosphodiesterase [Trypanosoma brucei gambiense DAL972]|eukprot:XP_011780134.1 glycerophosphoryl diester phosphodiesterase [Trypanosoma brucei gambiense DAL972]